MAAEAIAGAATGVVAVIVARGVAVIRVAAVAVHGICRRRRRG